MLSKNDFPRICNSNHALGLILTYCIDYELFLEKLPFIKCSNKHFLVFNMIKNNTDKLKKSMSSSVF